MRSLLLLLGVLTGCGADRAGQLTQEVEALRQEVATLEQQAVAMQQVLDKARQAVERKATAQPPPGFDAARPLPKGDPSRPDVILLSIDTLRADHLGAWGYERDTSPFLDALAAEGTRFASAWSPSPWTLPSHTTLLTGRLPAHHGTIEDHVLIPKQIPLVQEAFQAAGYGTGASVSTLFVSSRFGFERGFDFFHDFDIRDPRANNAATIDAEHVFAWALDWAQQQPENKPLFLFLHVYDAHYAYNAPEPWNSRFDRPPRVGDAVYKNYFAYKHRPLSDEQMAHQVAQYDEEIAYVDDTFRKLVEKWRAERPNVVIAVTSDHGEEFGERGSWGHAHTLFPEQLHIPLIVAGPGVRAQVIEDRAGLEDVAPTLASLARVPFPSGDGVDRAAQLRTGSAPAQGHVSAVFAETSRFHTLRQRWHAAPWDLYLDLNDGERWLCDLSRDPGCTRNLWDDEAARGEAMTRALHAWHGEPWEALQAGEVRVQGGQIVRGGERVEGPLAVRPGDRFAVHPLDAFVRFQPSGSDSQGPWRIIGGTSPGDGAPLAYHGSRFEIDAVDLTDAEREMLQALGYLQE